MYIKEFVKYGPDHSMIDNKFLEMIENVQNELEDLIGQNQSMRVEINIQSDDNKFKKLFEKYEMIQNLNDRDSKFCERALSSRLATKEFIE